jgi:hypothetical protein
MTLARVSIILPLQNGHIAGRATISVCMTYAGGFSTLRLFKSAQPCRRANPCSPSAGSSGTTPCLRRMRRSVFGDPLRAHPPEISLGVAPGNAGLVDDHRGTECDEHCDSEQHGRMREPRPPVILVDRPGSRRSRLCGSAHLHQIRSQVTRLPWVSAIESLAVDAAGAVQSGTASAGGIPVQSQACNSNT